MRKRGIKSKKPTKEVFYSYYNNKDISVEDIARLFNVSTATVYRWSTEFNKESEKKLSDKQIYIREDYNKNTNIKQVM